MINNRDINGKACIVNYVSPANYRQLTTGGVAPGNLPTNFPLTASVKPQSRPFGDKMGYFFLSLYSLIYFFFFYLHIIFIYLLVIPFIVYIAWYKL